MLVEPAILDGIDIPVAGDFNGDGIMDYGIFRAQGANSFSKFSIKSGSTLGMIKQAIFPKYIAGDYPINATIGSSGQLDLDGDQDVDRDDVNIIMRNLRRSTEVSTYRSLCDLDTDGQITILDARRLTLQCTLPQCATQW